MVVSLRVFCFGEFNVDRRSDAKMSTTFSPRPNSDCGVPHFWIGRVFKNRQVPAQQAVTRTIQIQSIWPALVHITITIYITITVYYYLVLLHIKPNTHICLYI